MRVRKAAAAAVLGLILLTQGGCAVKEETACERVMNYMSERYEDSFTCPVYYGGYPGSPVHEYRLNAEKLGGAVVRVEVRGRGTPGERYLDNYIGIKYMEELEKKVEDLLTTSLLCEKEDIVLLMDPAQLGVSDHWTQETSLDEYSTDPAAGIFFRAVVRNREDLRDSDRRKMTEHWLEDDLFMARICCTGWIYFVPEDTELEGIDETSFFERILKHHYYDARLFFNMRTDQGVDDFSWDITGFGPEAYEYSHRKEVYLADLEEKKGAGRTAETGRALTRLAERPMTAVDGDD